MTFASGKDTKIYRGGYDLSAYFYQQEVSPAVELFDTTTFGKSYRQRVPTIKDGSVSLSGYSDNAVGAVTRVINAALGSVSNVEVIMPVGDAVGAWGWGLLVGEDDIQYGAPFDGVTTIDLSQKSSGAVEPLQSLRALAAATGTGSGTTVDRSAATANGGAGYLIITDFSGTDFTLTIRHSTDNFAGDNTELLAFTQVTAANQAQRVAFTGTCKRYVRVLIAGTFTSVTAFAGVSAL